MTRRQQRVLWLMGLLLVIGVSTLLVVDALRDHLVFFHTPTELQAGQVPSGKYIRVGGLVKPNSLVQISDSAAVHFVIVDDGAQVDVFYEGLLPDLFKEGQGAVLEGRWQSSQFIADRVFAKHDENYMPPEVAEAASQMHRQYSTEGARP